MYPDLSYLFHDIFGTSVDNWTSVFKSFGLMLGVAFLASGIMIRSELKRLEQEGKISPFVKKQRSGTSINEVLINALFLAILIAKLPYIINHFEAFKGNPASIIFSSLGNWPLGILAGALMGGYGYYKYNKESKTKPKETEIIIHPYEKTTDIIFRAAISGVIGSRLLSIFENFGDFLKDPIGQLFSGSGLTIYGGLILAFFVVYRYVKKIGIKPVYMMDIAAMGILLGYGIGRIGCQIAGDGDWGIVAAAQPEWWFLPDWLWSYNYPNNVNNDGVSVAGCDEDALRQAGGYIEEKCKEVCGVRYCHELEENVYPTPLYETILSVLGFVILWSVRKRVKIAGVLFFMYMLYNGIERFFIERIRVNERYDLFGLNLSQAQYISIGFILIGILGIIFYSRKKEGWEREEKINS